MAYLFQQEESRIMQLIIEQLNLPRQEYIHIHDAVLLKHKPNNTTIKEIKSLLNNQSSWYKIDISEILGWWDNTVTQAHVEEQHHQEIMAVQKHNAKIYSQLKSLENNPVFI
jgi:hypothetical protein